ncbi:phosphogluconate dehydrogenase (NAD(+)-dependent, decarboxylating) [Pseudomonas sp. B392_1p]|uniref:phosphogluconate dehydrogenase (NAD(+)-dependent, decarboxylating) n=1 Tax=Pseudomonas sp. B392_1p TaxID=3457507 RepID=UPI003FD1398D
MKLGMIGLGRMGANMAQRLLRGGHQVVGLDPKPEARSALEQQGGESAESLQTLVAKLPTPRLLWLMVPAGDVTDATLTNLLPLLGAGDTLIDGGNSNYHDTPRRAEMAAEQGIDYLDCGTSGGIWGLAEGYSLMIGGGEAAVERLRPIFETLAPGKERGWGRVGPAGAGHFCKMVHNGIEYGLMQAYAEGFAILRHKEAFDLDLAQIADIWREGSVVRSWLLDLCSDALQKNPQMTGIAPYVADSGEGRWTVAEAIELNVPAPVITLALLQRLRSRDAESYADRLLAALRNEFGGHAIKKE